MKKIFAATLFVMVSFLAQAQENAVKVNILSPFVVTANGAYERALTDKLSLQLGAFYSGISIKDTKFRGFGITPELRYYFGEKGALNGFYVAPYLRYQKFDLSVPYTVTNPETKEVYRNTAEAKFATIGGGAVAGYQLILGNRFSVDAFMGPGYNGGSLKVKGDSEHEKYFNTGLLGGFGLRAGLTFGVAF